MTDAPERIWAGKNVTEYSVSGRKLSVTFHDGNWSAVEQTGWIEYIRADLAAPRVKLLVWESWHFGDHFARTIWGGVYNVRGNLWRKPGNRTTWEGPCADPYAAAQAHYECLIREALV